MKKPLRSSSEMVLPREIMFEMLKELPVKSLLRLRCVSKLWFSIIDDPLFVELHRTHSQSRPGGIRLLDRKLRGYEQPGGFKYSIYSVDLDGGSKSVCLINDELPVSDSSNNGLVCLKKPHRLWNPSTRECIDLPPLPAHVPTGQRYLIPVFNPSTKTYKVLSACEIKSCSGYVRNIDFRILSLGASTSTSSSWRQIDFWLKYFEMLIQETCCVNNVIYFRVGVRVRVNDSSFKQEIFAFDVATEKFSAAFGCPSREGLSCRLYMVQVGEKLAVLTTDTSGSATFIRILEDYEEDGLNLEGGCIKEANWKKVSLNFPGDWGIGLPKGLIEVAPIGKFHTNNKVLFWLESWSDSTRWFYFYYDLESKTCGTLYKLEDFGIHHLKDRLLTTYVETLYRLKL